MGGCGIEWAGIDSGGVERALVNNCGVGKG
jgi:hypothetical protein